jgi:glycogen debranching enzyme
MLAGAYFERSGDRAFIESIWSNIEAALHWLDNYGDVDNDGFVEYMQHTPTGLINQGWKDSNDSVFHADGRQARGPIALCEVQAYVYAAKRYAAGLAAMLGHDERAQQLRTQAETLQLRFEEQFWCEELATYALALDGDKNPCRVRSSNAGHVLFGGIASAERARRVADTLMASGSCTRWGIRTLDSGERLYNPMSYHNGTIWPHDNALITLGFARYGLSEYSISMLTRIFDSALFMEDYRLPELFCGFDRSASEGPIRYPMACAPQAWASASVFAMLAACLRISFDGTAEKIYFQQPSLPPFLEKLRIHNLVIGEHTIDLLCQRHEQNVLVSVTRRSGPADVIILQ